MAGMEDKIESIGPDMEDKITELFNKKMKRFDELSESAKKDLKEKLKHLK
jgi:Na+/phosphate symporter